MTARPSPGPDRLEWLATLHAAGLILAASWAFGGNIGWARTGLSWVAPASFVMTAALFRHRLKRRETVRDFLLLLPLLAYVALVLGSTAHPLFREARVDGVVRLARNIGVSVFVPATGLPSASLQALAIGAGMYLAGANLYLGVRHRRLLRGLTAFCGLNAAALAVLGSLQVLAGKPLYFGLISGPNLRSFSTFLYNNHWAAFAVLGLAAALACFFRTWHDARKQGGFLRSRAPLHLTAVVLLALALPLAASRAGLVLSGLLLLGAGVIVLRGRGVATLGFALATGGAAWFFGADALAPRIADTRHQLSTGLLAERAALYADTLELAAQRPWFGWGLEAYGPALLVLRPRPPAPSQQYVASYQDAHSDWLESLAETGVVGTGLLLLAGLLPLVHALRRGRPGLQGRWLLLGTGVVLGYAWVEFPFGNPAVIILFWTLFFVALAGIRVSAASHRP
jgi:O-antigen ligase